MSLALTGTFTFNGIDAVPVEVQVQIASGLPAFTIVGLPNKAVNESRERVRAALATIGVALPPKRLLVNLSPADLLKDGSHFDLPIAVAILAAMEQVPAERVQELCVMGELALDGRILEVPGILPAALAAAASDRALVCPAAQGAEASWAGARGVIAAPDLAALVGHLRGSALLPPPAAPRPAEQEAAPDLADVRGQAAARRALEIAAAGRHNLLLVGPPGSGKSLLAARLPGLLPPLSPAEALDVSVVQSLGGVLSSGRIPTRRPFRAPHHSATQAALIGGGSRLRPGEVSLAHRGVLFLDELPEFSRSALEALRQPLETGEAVISRAAARAVFPARFQLVAAMNPCRCGSLGMPGRECARAPACADEYRQRISGALLDRIDMIVEMSPIPARELMRAEPGEPSATVAERVARAAQAAGRRGGLCNAEAPLGELRRSSSGEALTLLEQAADRLQLSSRGVLRALRVARTIADLAGEPLIQRRHLAEALAYRNRVFVAGVRPG